MKVKLKSLLLLVVFLLTFTSIVICQTNEGSNKHLPVIDEKLTLETQQYSPHKAGASVLASASFVTLPVILVNVDAPNSVTFNFGNGFSFPIINFTDVINRMLYASGSTLASIMKFDYIKLFAKNNSIELKYDNLIIPNILIGIIQDHLNAITIRREGDYLSGKMHLKISKPILEAVLSISGNIFTQEQMNTIMSRYADVELSSLGIVLYYKRDESNGNKYVYMDKHVVKSIINECETIFGKTNRDAYLTQVKDITNNPNVKSISIGIILKPTS